MSADTLATYPYVTVTVACRYCSRRGSYRLARLSGRYGADLALDDLLATLTADCTAAHDRRPRASCHGAYFPDLMQRRPADLPARPLRLLTGGRE